MLLNENFRMVRVPRRSLLLGLTAMLFVTGGLLASLNLTRAASPEAVADEPDKSERDKDAAVKPDAGKSAEHSGMVVDADTGEPIAGATVTVTRLESLNWKQLGVTKSVTDENGKYTFTIPPEQLRERLLYILFDVDHPQYAERHCGSYGYGMIVNNMKNGEEPWFAKLQMVRGEKLSGRLIDEAGRPVSGVQIRCSCRPASGFDRIRSAHIKGVSDEQGQFDLMVTAEGRAKLALIPPEHCMQQMDLGEKRGDIGDVVLKRGFSLRGIVQNAKGEPMRDLWVNIQPAEEQFRESYEMIRSSKIDDQGRFTTRPLQAGKYRINVENKATGALEKVKYANFHDDPPAAMFVTKSLNITEDLAAEPMIIRAVPHVLITAQFYKPNGELSPGHSPHVTGQFDGEFIWIPQGRRTGEGRFELMVPHGLVNVELRFTTNEHSGLMVQFPGGELSPQDSYRFERIEEDIDNIRIVRHRAGILKLDIVDESGKQLENSGIFAHYKLQQNPSDEVKAGTQIGWNRENGLFRLSSIVPGVPVAVRCSAPGYETSWAEYTLEAEQRRTVTVKLKKTDSKDGNQPAKGDAN